MPKKSKVEKKDNRNIIIGVVIVVVIAVLLTLLLTNTFKKDTDNKKNKKDEESAEKVKSDEKSIKKDYGFSKEDAIKAVKGAYNSDNYKFDAEANEDNTYTVTVTNIDNNAVKKYVVDPSTGTYSPLNE